MDAVRAQPCPGPRGFATLRAQAAAHCHGQQRAAVRGTEVLHRRDKADCEIEHVNAQAVRDDVPAGAQPHPERIQSNQSREPAPASSAVGRQGVHESADALVDGTKDPTASSVRGVGPDGQASKVCSLGSPRLRQLGNVAPGAPCQGSGRRHTSSDRPGQASAVPLQHAWLGNWGGAHCLNQARTSLDHMPSRPLRKARWPATQTKRLDACLLVNIATAWHPARSPPGKRSPHLTQ